ncbi:GNAT family N-acetyltransferase [Streptomyces sp. Vc74B-19]|uniref:GNAT family N-acetyltransferase n=1 Tax=unclassified Streptomyces TaxID=2593676 RepID=UPI001BFCA024|nr:MULTISPECIES: GNAT family N-acetyltransferase [unclassified Streptomyces]MBT3165973.1 GNAT family N-acetyltransferase [Streptomyces sp. Vc74B-19]MCO4698812.1 GNAT family N-acetyltransferase [Streptomyces sp. RO-S4]MDU0300120.1 GNAT family N-acetyltransferase [Streptomyces sp. PAL114]
MSDTVILHAEGTHSAPALVLRPWCMADVADLVAVFRDPVLRRWTSSALETEGDARQWVRSQERAWAAGTRYGFAVLEVQPDPLSDRLAGQVVLKDVAPGNPSAEVGYWTAAHARGRGVAPRALEALTGWAFDAVGADGLERLELLHQVDNPASCSVARKAGYDFDAILPAAPPAFPRDGHLHIRPKSS